MVIDPQYIGYGIGLVMFGWFCGAIVGSIIGAIKKGRLL